MSRPLLPSLPCFFTFFLKVKHFRKRTFALQLVYFWTVPARMLLYLVQFCWCSCMTNSEQNTPDQPLLFTVNEAVNPLSIDPNERVTPSGHEIHNGDLSQESLGSLGVSEIGVIPPPPMFSSPSPPSRHIIPPPKEHSGHHGVGVTTARGHDLSEHRAKGENY